MVEAVCMSVPTVILKIGTGIGWMLKLQNIAGSGSINLIRYPWVASSDKIRSELGWKSERTTIAAINKWKKSTRAHLGILTRPATSLKHKLPDAED